MSVNLKKYLAGVLPAAELELLVRSYDVIGDIAVIIVPCELAHRERLIGEAILANVNTIRVVARRDGLYGGEFRTLPLKVIAGENRLETLHREYGVHLMVDLAKVYFSVRSSTERKRVADLVGPGEEVLVLFSGIGPYPLVIAGNSDPAAVVGIEKNPDAHQYGLINLARNKRLRNITLHCGDVADLLPAMNRRFDRLVMPLPGGAQPFLPAALAALRPGGFLHYYDMRRADGFSESIEVVRQAAVACQRRLIAAQVVKCGHCAPRTFRICVDCRIG